MNDTLALMDFFLGPPAADALDRVKDVDTEAMTRLLEPLRLANDVVGELGDHWEATRASARWSGLLAALSQHVRRHRGDVDAHVAIWPDLDGYGDSGRLLYYYLVALEREALLEHYAERGVPPDVADDTLGALARHGETHRLKHGTTGVDAGWWMVPILRGDILQVGCLKFHYLHLDAGTLAPRPWLDEVDVARHGEGFRPGDPSLGVHIPARVDLSDAVLDATFTRAREVLSRVWPVSTRRIATCQSWMMDDRLIAALGDDSRIVRFQRRFALIDPYADDVENVMYFVFGVDHADVSRLTPTSRLQETVKSVLTSGDVWHSRTGWMDFD